MTNASIRPRANRRRRIAIVSSIAAALGLIFPIATSSYYAWRSAREAQELRLELVASKVAERARIALVQANAALEGLAASDDTPCSAEHIALMRRFTLNTLSVEEIGYMDGSQVRCTTWADSYFDEPARGADFVLNGDVQAFVGMHSHIPGSAPMLGLRKNHYLVLVNAERFTDITVPAGVQLAFLRSGSPVLSHTRDMPEDMLTQVAGGKTPIDEDGHLLRKVDFDGWSAVAIGPSESRSEIGLQLELLLPVGLLSAAIALVLVVKLSRRRLSPLAELRLALRRKEFLMHYQPIVNLTNGRLHGVEALIRWQRPDGDTVRPDLFIPLAEEHGVISDITAVVFKMVAADLRDVLRAHPQLHVSINLSAQDITDPNALKTLRAQLEAAGIKPAQVWLEVTERGCVAVGVAADSTLAQARAAGYQVAIDDFGTGYCGLQYLQKLPLDTIKIDRSFVQTVATDSVTSVVLPHIIQMSHSLQLSIVAEGVETQAQADYLQQSGVQYAQGWLFSKALPLHELKQYVERDAAMK
ncbi:EAL domain-containing protein [Pigmentiphaga aceris]|uniref:cyclic-guanylate-specific phosphodiesterase n=1 Tax=Pigmentiphaga aceris TaxID=1940612 RepID=A0A5C0B046_9BURK|nr:EAL domain-containing protein [Pigmentiphaga aceris]QEI06490.1 EAL domain-containing protein [Pigmentiphaga aceris]